MNQEIIKILMLTDRDLDGVGCAIVAKELFSKDERVQLEVRFVGRKIYEEFQKFLDNKEYYNYDFIFVTDLSISKDQAEAVLRAASIDITSNRLFKRKKLLSDKLIILDHHDSALWLNDYPFANVITESTLGSNEVFPTSGTLLTLLYLTEEFIPNFLKKDFEDYQFEFDSTRLWKLQAFVYLVRDYDTWLWKKNNDTIPKQFNDWFLDNGIEKLFENYEDIIFSFRVDDKECKVTRIPSSIQRDLKYINIKREEYINAALKRMKVIDSKFGKIGILFAEQYTSELGNKASELNPELMFIALFNGDRFSMRTVRNDINLGTDVAKKISENGGGIAKAAGFNVKDEVLLAVLKTLFSNELPQPIIKEVEKVIYNEIPVEHHEEENKLIPKFINNKPIEPKKKDQPIKKSIVAVETSNEEFRKLVNDQITERRKNRDLSSMGLMSSIGEESEEKESKIINEPQQIIEEPYNPRKTENAHKRFDHGFSIADLVEADEKEKSKKKEK